MRRRMMMVKGGLLPQGYTQLDYVSNGGQVCYIDTGVPVSDVSFELNINVYAQSSSTVTAKPTYFGICVVGGKAFIPAQRDADGVVGFYNITDNVFLFSPTANQFLPPE